MTLGYMRFALPAELGLTTEISKKMTSYPRTGYTIRQPSARATLD
jgi:hypothetical protein